MSEWSHLPNAEHIDRILAHLKAHPEKWIVTRSVARNAAWHAAHNAAYTTARAAVYDAARSAAWYATRAAARDEVYTTARAAAWDEVWNAVSGAIIALITNDASAYLLKEKPEHVELLASLGQPEAILLLSAVRAMSHE
jgi:hypothetical protein